MPFVAFADFSGNRSSTAQTFNTYNPMYPKPLFGLIAPLGPVNLLTGSAGLKILPNDKWLFSASTDFFWRERNTDGLYTPALGPAIVQIDPGDSKGINRSKFIEKDYIAEINYKPTNYLVLGLLGGYFPAGAYLKEVGHGKDKTYFSSLIKLIF